MKRLSLFPWLTLSRVYGALALAASLVLSPLVYAPLPLLMLLLYLYLEWGRRVQLKVPFYLFLALSLPLLFQPLIGPWLIPLFTLPLMPLLDYSLRQFALTGTLEPGKQGRRTTRLCQLLFSSLGAVGLAAVALGSWGLLLSCLLLLSYLATLMGVVLRRTSPGPCHVQVANYKGLAGVFGQMPLRLENRCRLGGQIELHSPYSWFHLRPKRLVLDRPALELEASFTPPLAGPGMVEAGATFLDPWGLVRADFPLGMMKLFIIPRAQYAEWLAWRYLEISAGGEKASMTAAVTTTQRASRKGIEYYGLRSYQPGDSAKVIDWKHTLKLRQVVVKEFVDSGVEAAIVAVNLSVTDEEEKDKLAYGLISTALTLARENIPSALTAYDYQGVALTTQLLDPHQALLQALNLSRGVRVSLSPRRYLGSPNVTRLRGNIHRLRQSSQGAAIRLAELLHLEYLALNQAARENPATAAVTAALRAMPGKATVVIISGHNHDSEAIAFLQYTLKERGYQTLEIELGRKR